MSLAGMHADLIAALAAIPNLSVYDGDVTPEPPADAGGRALPHLVVWSGAGTPIGQPLSAAPSGAVLWRAHIQCVGGTQARALQAAAAARTALAQARIGDGPMVEEPLGAATVLIDRDVAPPRFFLPLIYTCSTPT